MTVRASMRAGLGGMIILAALSLSSRLFDLIPVCGGILSVFSVLLYFFLCAFIGAVASYFLAPPRRDIEGAKVGALAGAVAHFGSGAINVLFGLLLGAIALSLDRAGVDFKIEALKFSNIIGDIAKEGIVCPVGIVIGAFLGSVGGYLLAMIKPNLTFTSPTMPAFLRPLSPPQPEVPAAQPSVAVVPSKSLLPVMLASGTSFWAIISLVAGIASWFIAPLAGAIVAVVAGHKARNEISRNRQLAGSGLAAIGLILGYSQLVVVVVPICVSIFMGVLAIVGPPVARAVVGELIRTVIEALLQSGK